MESNRQVANKPFLIYLILNVRNMPNIWTDRHYIWHTYAYSSGNGHELKKNNPLIPEGHGGLGGHQFINMGKLPKFQTTGTIGTTFGTRVHIHLGMDMS